MFSHYFVSPFTHAWWKLRTEDKKKKAWILFLAPGEEKYQLQSTFSSIPATDTWILYLCTHKGHFQCKVTWFSCKCACLNMIINYIFQVRARQAFKPLPKCDNLSVKELLPQCHSHGTPWHHIPAYGKGLKHSAHWCFMVICSGKWSRRCRSVSKAEGARGGLDNQTVCHFK